ncbi:UNVERIFIED_CONTAM: spore coat protein I [Acetivibrio alkalicellulosi]
MPDFERKLSSIYGLKINNVYSYKHYHVIEESTGKKVLKSMNISPERVLFIHGAKEHLYKNNFKNLDRYLCTIEGKPYSIIDGTVYTVAYMANGRECDFDLKEDVIRATKSLALLHRASKGYIPPSSSLGKNDLGNLTRYFGKRLDEIKRAKKIAQREKGKFDYLLLEYIDYFFDLGEDALNKIYKSEYFNLVDKAKIERNFCHHDFSYSNIICDGDKTFIINFDYCTYELKIYDVANLLRRKMRKCSWNINEAMAIIDAYVSVEPITHDEFEVLKIMLQFPHKFWRVINKYYNSKRTWREMKFYAKFEEVINEIEGHKNFLKDFQL